MSNAGSAIDEIQQILAQPEWDSGAIEDVNEILVRHGFTEHLNDNVFKNRFLRAQLVAELDDHIRDCLMFWEDRLGFHTWPLTTLGFATSIVKSLEDIHSTLPQEES